jgi:hypothetical protein
MARSHNSPIDQLADHLINTNSLHSSPSSASCFSLDISLIESDSDVDDSMDSMFPSTIPRPRASNTKQQLALQQIVRKKALDEFNLQYQKRRYDVS